MNKVVLGYRLSREEVALRILCALLGKPDSKVSIDSGNLAENEIRVAFRIATTFEQVSDELGGRPVVTHGRGHSRHEYEDVDD